MSQINGYFNFNHHILVLIHLFEKHLDFWIEFFWEKTEQSTDQSDGYYLCNVLIVFHYGSLNKVK